MKSTRWGDRGQSTVEFALVLPLVALVALFVVQAGLIVRDQLLVSHAAREAARAASVSDGNRLGAAMMAARNAGPLNADQLTGNVTMIDGDTSVRVVVAYQSVTSMALIGALVPDVSLSATVVMRAESNRKHGP